MSGDAELWVAVCARHDVALAAWRALGSPDLTRLGRPPTAPEAAAISDLERAARRVMATAPPLGVRPPGAPPPPDGPAGPTDLRLAEDHRGGRVTPLTPAGREWAADWLPEPDDDDAADPTHRVGGPALDLLRDAALGAGLRVEPTG